ncbi:DeoR/GlpR family DNA-binding transcription regulator [Anaerobium acetethylicum]|uniref:DNA-binding transcriptional regulator of sugar metabolism, DeoR/GlpR family n=1 Tax=Anaerobium acetethylicum TaxID=1619234 RepID=A0A1D3TXB5_9FIRM|nr:DeoR/GlpR family DNA-binding transcription regulator [Anaerobium acetethylicum]SCP98942.1 DNA-binding transcriptional regulator of sugar metabolism, DeoR/GlpR family [Anaerobium acetethylicum]
MLAAERHNTILMYISEHGKATTNELSSLLNVSATTIRNDLNFLEKQGQLLKAYGGAFPISHPDIEHPAVPVISQGFLKRASQNKAEKEAISEAALKYIHDDQCIILDASTTSYTLAKKLNRFNRLTVVTNGLYTMLTLKEFPNITVILIGGIVTPQSGFVEGTLSSDLINKINADIAFFSATSFTPEDGLTVFNMYEAAMKNLFLKRSKHCIALLDHSKLGSISVASFGTSDSLSLLITDEKIDKETLNEYKEKKIKVEVAPYFRK